MRAICVDDVLPIVEDTVKMCRSLPQIDEVVGFTRPKEALAWLEDNAVDLALFDIDMPEITGLMLAKQLKRIHPDAAVIFLTAFPEFALDAFKLHASGYLLKPVNADDLQREVEYALSRMSDQPSKHIVVQTFGGFEVLVDGVTLDFARAKSKELLAYLVDQNGKGVTRAAIFAALWEDELYNRSKQKYLDVVIRSLRDTLRKAGIDEILEIKGGFIRIRPELLDCDLYRFLKGDMEAVNAYRGEYMRDYPWAILDSRLAY